MSKSGGKPAFPTLRFRDCSLSSTLKAFLVNVNSNQLRVRKAGLPRSYNMPKHSLCKAVTGISLATSGEGSLMLPA